ncbi:unnamed protein product [Caenorhabditis brenneri]
MLIIICLMPFKVADVRKCCFCGTTDLRKNLCSVTEGVPPTRSSKSVTNLITEDDGESDSTTSFETDDEEYEVEEDIGAHNSNNNFALQHKSLLCDWSAIFPYISRCENCLQNGLKVKAKTRVRYQGAVVLALFTCTICENEWNWASSEVLDTNAENGLKSYRMNTDITGAIVFTGNGFSGVESFSKLLDIPFPSESMYYRALKNHVNPTVDSFYDRHQEIVMDKLVNSINSGSPLHLAGDGQFDSRGYSAMMCRFSMMCQKSGLIVDFQVIRKERKGSSVTMERVGHEISLDRVLDKLRKAAEPGKKLVESFTSDRCNSMSIVMKKFPEIIHKYDNWHFVRSIRKDITEKFTRVYFQPMIPWIRPLFAHIRTSIATAKGDGTLAWEMINSFFHHIYGTHDNFEEIEDCSFQVYRKCSHSPNIASEKTLLERDNSQHTQAVNAVKKILRKGTRRQDLSSVDPVFSTNSVESFHAVATSYTSKEKFFEKPSYEMRSKLSVLHWNHLKLDEDAGLRPIIRKVPIYCKTKKVVIWKNRKLPSSHQWRFKLMEQLRITAAAKNTVIFDDVDATSDSESAANHDETDEPDDIDDEEVRVRTEVERMLYQF